MCCCREAGTCESVASTVMPAVVASVLCGPASYAWRGRTHTHMCVPCDSGSTLTVCCKPLGAGKCAAGRISRAPCAPPPFSAEEEENERRNKPAHAVPLASARPAHRKPKVKPGRPFAGSSFVGARGGGLWVVRATHPGSHPGGDDEKPIVSCEPPPC